MVAFSSAALTFPIGEVPFFASRRKKLACSLEGSEILAIMGELKLYGRKVAFDEIIAPTASLISISSPGDVERQIGQTLAPGAETKSDAVDPVDTGSSHRQPMPPT